MENQEYKDLCQQSARMMYNRNFDELSSEKQEDIKWRVDFQIECDKGGAV